MSINGPLIATLFLFTIIGCTSTPPATTDKAIISIAADPAPEIEETNLSPLEKQYPSAEGSPITKDVDIAQPPLISKETVDCALGLLIDKECAGFQIGDAPE